MPTGAEAELEAVVDAAITATIAEVYTENEE